MLDGIVREVENEQQLIGYSNKVLRNDNSKFIPEAWCCIRDDQQVVYVNYDLSICSIQGYFKIPSACFSHFAPPQNHFSKDWMGAEPIFTEV